MDEQRRIRPTAEAFKAMAHPLRVRLLALLRADGPSTASALAGRLDVSSGLTSYHLRALADAGFIVEDDTRGNARDRWWRAAHEVTSWEVDDYTADPETAAMAEVFAANWDRLRDRAVGAFETGAWEEAWRRAAGRSDMLLRLTPAELQELTQKLFLAAEPYLERSWARRDGVVPTPEGARAVMVFLNAVPIADVAGLLSAGLEES
jgi:DNA-binding transcriptional ArsR family regulator